MKVVFLGATGMVGAGTLREALVDREIDAVLSVGRRPCGTQHPKLRELIVADLFDTGAIEKELVGWDACIWAIGVSSVGMSEPEYAKVTEELTLSWANTLLRLNPVFSFCYCSAAGADGSAMWARVRQRVESTLRAMPFLHSGCVRPGFIRPGPGIKSQVKLYQTLIVVFSPILPLLVAAFPAFATTSSRLGRAMVRAVQGRNDAFILESSDINRLGAESMTADVFS